MAKPRDPETVPINILELHHMVMEEISNAMSSLNMQPSPIPATGENGFLADTDYWCAHSYEHMLAALKMLNNYKNT